MIIQSIMIVVFGGLLLAWAADRFVVGAAAIARNLGLSSLVVGVVVVGFGTSFPEMVVSALAAWQGHSQISIGSALGSNITNISLVLGVSALIMPLRVHSKLLVREYPMLIVSILIAFLLMMDGYLGRLNGVLLFIGFLGVMVWMLVQVHKADREHDPMSAEYQQKLPSAMSTMIGVVWLLIGLILLLVSSQMLIYGATSIARYFGISDLVIGLTVVAVGTSLPELAASVTAALKNEHDIAIGNVVGSNMFNILAVMAMPGLIHPGVVPRLALYRDFPITLLLSLVLILMSYRFKNSKGVINRFEGLLLLLAYVGYLVLLYFE